MDILFTGGGCQNHHRDTPEARVGSNPLQKIRAANLREFNIQEDEMGDWTIRSSMGAFLQKVVQGLLSIADRHYVDIR